MKKGKRMDAMNGETLLPEAMIQHIQSFMREKEAARSSILSKSWYNAWLTRPTIDFDDRHFSCNRAFKEFAKKTMQRYQDLSLKIQSFKLRTYSSGRRDLAHDLITNAIKIGATDLHIELLPFTLPQELLGSKTLVTLYAMDCGVNDDTVISCSRLKSLRLSRVAIASNVFKAITTCCISMEELSLSYCTSLALNSTTLYELHKLSRLYLHKIEVDAMFFTDFASRFPCLKDLTILHCCCDGYTIIQIASTSLETIRFEPVSESQYDTAFEVPNIRKFTYSGIGLPSQLSIEVGSSREWDFNLSLVCSPFDIQNLKRFLTKFRRSRTSLSIYVTRSFELDEVGIEVVPKPVVVENLMFNAPSSFHSILEHVFGVCRPKFITQYRLMTECSNAFEVVYKRLMDQVITPNCGIPDLDLFEKFGLKKVNMEVYDMLGTSLLPVLLKTPLDVTKPPKNYEKVRFELIWDF